MKRLFYLMIFFCVSPVWGMDIVPASSCGDYERVASILNRDKNQVNHTIYIDGTQPLHRASQMGHPAIVQLLLDNGAAIDKTLNNGVTPLLLAAQEGHFEVIKILLERGAYVDGLMPNSTTPLYMACQNGHAQVVELLLQRSADVNKVGRFGVSCLHIAVYKKYVGIVNSLLKKGANPACTIRDTEASAQAARKKRVVSYIFSKCFNCLSKELKEKSSPRTRLLWIALQKEGPADCPFARLPREMIAKICSYDLSSDEEKEEVGWFALKRHKDIWLKKIKMNG